MNEVRPEVVQQLSKLSHVRVAVFFRKTLTSPDPLDGMNLSGQPISTEIYRPPITTQVDDLPAAVNRGPNEPQVVGRIAPRCISETAVHLRSLAQVGPSQSLAFTDVAKQH